MAKKPNSTKPESWRDVLPVHLAAELFPPIEGAEFEELVADVREHGVRESVVLYEGKILDGRNRYRAARAAGVPCPTRTYDGDDPLAFVISLNLKRRHLTESQRAMVAARLANMSHGGHRKSDQAANWPLDVSQQRAATLLNVGERSVRRAADVRDHGAPQLVAAVARGEAAVSTAADLTELSIEQQQQIVARGEHEILKAAKEIRARKTAERYAETIRRMAEISQGTRALPTGQRFPVIYADPPWHFEVYDAESGSEHAPETHYPCMQIDDICAVPVRELASADAVLFLWTTVPHLQAAFAVVEAWGFRYVSNICWVKERFGLGYWVRNQHEILVIARRGDMPAPLPPQRPPSVIIAPRREHSQKPDEAYDVIEQMYPDLPRLELFARGRARPNWSAWGNQTPMQQSPSVDDVPHDDSLAIPGFLRRSAP